AAVQQVRAGAADQDIVASQPAELVVAGAAFEPVVGIVAGEPVGHRMIGADHILDVGQLVPVRIAAEPDPGRQVDVDARGRGGVVGRVGAGPSLQFVGAGE